MKILACVLIVVLAVALLGGCAPGPNPSEGKGGEPAGFWTGLWQGSVMFFTFIWSLFNRSVGIYEVNNNGGWYNFGYLLGAMIFLGGGAGGACKGSNRKR